MQKLQTEKLLEDRAADLDEVREELRLTQIQKDTMAR